MDARHQAIIETCIFDCVQTECSQVSQSLSASLDRLFSHYFRDLIGRVGSALLPEGNYGLALLAETIYTQHDRVSRAKINRRLLAETHSRRRPS